MVAVAPNKIAPAPTVNGGLAAENKDGFELSRFEDEENAEPSECPLCHQMMVPHIDESYELPREFEDELQRPKVWCFCFPMCCGCGKGTKKSKELDIYRLIEGHKIFKEVCPICNGLIRILNDSNDD